MTERGGSGSTRRPSWLPNDDDRFQVEGYYHIWAPRPLSRSILWTPVGDARRSAPTGEYEVFVEQRALETMYRHVWGAGRSDEPFGYLFGELCEDRESQRRYVIITQAVASAFPLYEDESEQISVEAAGALRSQVYGHDGVLAGWYHRHREGPVRLSANDEATHREHFGEPWQVAILFSTNPGHPTGGCFQPRTYGVTAHNPLPFYELVGVTSLLARGVRRTRLDWENVETATEILVEPPPRPEVPTPTLPEAETAAELEAEVAEAGIGTETPIETEPVAEAVEAVEPEPEIETEPTVEIEAEAPSEPEFEAEATAEVEAEIQAETAAEIEPAVDEIDLEAAAGTAAEIEAEAPIEPRPEVAEAEIAEVEEPRVAEATAEIEAEVTPVAEVAAEIEAAIAEAGIETETRAETEPVAETVEAVAPEPELEAEESPEAEAAIFVAGIETEIPAETAAEIEPAVDEVELEAPVFELGAREFIDLEEEPAEEAAEEVESDDLKPVPVVYHAPVSEIRFDIVQAPDHESPVGAHPRTGLESERELEPAFASAVATTASEPGHTREWRRRLEVAVEGLMAAAAVAAIVVGAWPLRNGVSSVDRPDLAAALAGFIMPAPTPTPALDASEENDPIVLLGRDVRAAAGRYRTIAGMYAAGRLACASLREAYEEVDEGWASFTDALARNPGERSEGLSYRDELVAREVQEVETNFTSSGCERP